MNKFLSCKIGLIFLTVVFFGNNVYSQQPSAQELSNFTKLVDIIPPSPNAAALGKYGGMDVSLSSGMVNFSIPVFTFQSSNLQLPISLSYSSNGLKVDEIASRTGTAWNFNAGGVITRTVYGKIDEYSQRLAPPAGFPARTTATMNFIQALSLNDGVYDAEPEFLRFPRVAY
jgi:hypothetical protein